MSAILSHADRALIEAFDDLEECHQFYCLMHNKIKSAETIGDSEKLSAEWREKSKGLLLKLEGLSGKCAEASRADYFEKLHNSIGMLRLAYEVMSNNIDMQLQIVRTKDSISETMSAGLRYGSIANGTAAAACLGALSQILTASPVVSTIITLAMMAFCIGSIISVFGVSVSCFMHLRAKFLGRIIRSIRGVAVFTSLLIYILTTLLGSAQILRHQLKIIESQPAQASATPEKQR